MLGGTGAFNNLAAVIVLLNREVNVHPSVDGIDRGDLSLDQIDAARAALPTLADGVTAELAGRL